eukprot:scaffold10197_cov270-Chaetoceros_neogracile.AAC.17
MVDQNILYYDAFNQPSNGIYHHTPDRLYILAPNISWILVPICIRPVVHRHSFQPGVVSRHLHSIISSAIGNDSPAEFDGKRGCTIPLPHKPYPVLYDDWGGGAIHPPSESNHPPSFATIIEGVVNS